MIILSLSRSTSRLSHRGKSPDRKNEKAENAQFTTGAHTSAAPSEDRLDDNKDAQPSAKTAASNKDNDMRTIAEENVYPQMYTVLIQPSVTFGSPCQFREPEVRVLAPYNIFRLRTFDPLLLVISYVNLKKLTAPDACPITRRFPLNAEHRPR